MAKLSSPEIGVPVLKTKDARLRRVLMPIVVLLAVGAIIFLVASQGRGSTGSINGGGSTLAQPLIESAAVAYRDKAAADNPGRPAATGNDWVVDGGGIDYEATGSLGGIMRMDQKRTDFAVSDYPLSSKGLRDKKVTQFPIAVGAVAVVHNITSLRDQELRLDAATISAIYRGQITTWNDPAIADLNPDLTLPSLSIAPIFRSDGSGSTFGITSYLATDSAWSSGPGAGASVEWPVGKGASRSGGMIDAVKATDGGIGYVEPRQGVSAGLKLVALRNGADEFVQPNQTSITAALEGVDWTQTGDFSQPIELADETGAYPVSVGIYAMVTDQRGVTKKSLDFLSYIVDEFDVAKHGYVELPDDAKTAVRKHWRSSLGFTTPYAVSSMPARDSVAYAAAERD